MEYDQTITEDLITRVQEGDQEAFGEVFEVFVSPVYRFALFRTAHEQHAEQLTEAIFSRVWKERSKFRLQGKITFAVFIFQIVIRAVQSFGERMKKTKQARQNIDLSAPPQSPLSSYDDDRAHFIRSFSALPPAQAEALIFKYFCDLSNGEIAVILEKTEGAVRILQSRGLKKLRESLE